MKISWKPLSVLLCSVLLGACSSKEEPKQAADTAAQPAAATVAPRAAPAAAPAEAGKGESVFKNVCSMCHQTGAGGAPIKGNKAEWGPRIAQGKDVLYKHALEGFTGSKGQMPAKGANPSLSDDDVKAAVDYMVSQAQ